MPLFLKIPFLVLFLWWACFPWVCQGREILWKEKTGKVKVEDLGILVESATLEHRLQFNLPQTREPHLLLYYVVLQYGSHPFQILDINLDMGKSRVADAVPGRPGPHATLLHSSGRIYIGSGDPGFFMVYDPATGQSRQLKKLADKGAQYVIEGDDGAIYIGEAVKGYVERYDPKSGVWENYGIMDDPGPPYYRYAYTLGADGRYVYVAIGQNPWYLVIYDRVTQTQKVCWKDQWPREVTVCQGKAGGWFACCKGRDGKERWYKLSGGKPDSLNARPAIASLPQGVGPADRLSAPCEVDLDQATPDTGNGGRVTVRWRQGKTRSWQQASAKLRLGPMDIKRLYVAPDSTLFGFTSFYGPVFRYNPGKRDLVLLGRPQRSLYDALFVAGAWFLAGYPSATMRYDPFRSWNLSGSAKDLYDPLRNPHLLKVAPEGAAKYHYYLARGADGYIYFGGHHERSGVGGSLGWFHPKTKVTGGLRQPFLKYDVSDLIAAQEGSKIIFSSRSIENGTEGKLFIFDTHQKKVLDTLVPISGSRDTGKLLEVAPGMVLGVVSGMPRSWVYKVDLNQKKVLWKREMDGKAFGTVRSYDRRLVRGPDGQVWLYVNNTICRINPADGRHQKMVEAPPAGNLLFFEGDLYIYGGPTLRKIRGADAPPAE